MEKCIEIDSFLALLLVGCGALLVLLAVVGGGLLHPHRRALRLRGPVARRGRPVPRGRLVGRGVGVGVPGGQQNLEENTDTDRPAYSDTSYSDALDIT